MKRVLLLIGIITVLFIVTAPPAQAAPAVSLKFGAGAGLIGVETAFALTDDFSLIAQAGYFGYWVTAGLGARYYWLTYENHSVLRLFSSVYGNLHYYFYEEYVGFYTSLYGTAGLELLAQGPGPGGVRFAIELGGGWMFEPSFTDSLFVPVIGLSFGYQF